MDNSPRNYTLPRACRFRRVPQGRGLGRIEGPRETTIGGSTTRHAPRRTRQASERIDDPARPARARAEFVDALRGCAIAMMFAYHFSFDLNYFGAIRQDFNGSPFWLGFRAVIVSSFLTLVGMSLVLAHGRGFDARAFALRTVRIAACAAVVSFASWMMFPNSMIFFGILHFIALASVVGVACIGLRGWVLPLGLFALVVGTTVANETFDRPWLQWFGLMTHKPVTEDYVPFLPWFGVVLAGMYLGRALPETPAWVRAARWRPASAPTRALVFAGRHSLPVYMLHQPIFIAVLYLWFRTG